MKMKIRKLVINEPSGTKAMRNTATAAKLAAMAHLIAAAAAGTALPAMKEAQRNARRHRDRIEHRVLEEVHDDNQHEGSNPQ